MAEVTIHISFHQMENLAVKNSEFEEKWAGIYDDFEYLYEIRLQFPDMFDEIARISLDDKDHALNQGAKLINNLVTQLENQRDSEDTPEGRKIFIKKALQELHDSVDGDPLMFLEKMKEKLNREQEIARQKYKITEPNSAMRQGVCVILDLCDSKNNVKILKKLFGDLTYSTRKLNNKADPVHTPIKKIQDCLKNDVEKDDKSAIVIVIHAGKSDMTDEIKDFQNVFDECEKLKNKPKILINHVYNTNATKLEKPLEEEDILHICSQIEGNDTGEDSLFIQSLDRIVRKYHNKCDLYELLTKVLRDVEIHQHIVKGDQDKTSYHRIKFTTSLKREFKFSVTGPLCESLRSSNKGFSITKDGEELNDMTRDSLLCVTETFLEINDGDCFVVKPIKEKSFRLKHIMLKIYDCSKIKYDWTDSDDECQSSKVKNEETRNWVSTKTTKLPLQPIKELRISFKTRNVTGKIRDLRMKALLGNTDVYLGGNLKLQDDDKPSSCGHFYLLPGQYSDLGRISKDDLHKDFSVDAQCKETEINRTEHYRMDRKPRGFCVIVNVSNNRPGSLVDEVKMKQLFEELYFDVRIINNRTHAEIEKETCELASQISDLHQCLVVIVMGHGTSTHKHHSFCDVMEVERSSDYVLDVFKELENLIAKPKVFIIQTCFGDKEMIPRIGSTVDHDSETAATIKDVGTGECFSYHKNSDTVQLNATLEDFRSYRLPLEGSFLIQALDEMVRKKSYNEEFGQLLTSIKNKVQTLSKEHKAYQQAEVNDVKNKHLNLNPGYSVPEQPDVPMLNAENRISIEGSVVWTDTAHTVCIASKYKPCIKLFNVNTKKGTTYSPCNEENITGLLSGVAVSRMKNDRLNEHFIVARMHDGSRKALHIKIDETNWVTLNNLMVDEPFIACSVNNDGVAILSGSYGYSDAKIDIYRIEDAEKVKEISIVNDIGRFPEIEPLCLGTGDSMCYSYTKFYISCFITSAIYQVNVKGEIEHTFGYPASKVGMNKKGFFYKPCMVFSWKAGITEELALACYDGIHQGAIQQVRNETNISWDMDWKTFVPYPSGFAQGFWYNSEMYITMPPEESHTTSHFRINSLPKRLSKRVARFRENKDIPHSISELPGSLANTSEKDTVIICSDTTPQFTFVQVGDDNNRQPKVYTLTKGDFIKSALFVKQQSINGKLFFMLVVGYKNGVDDCAYHVCTVWLDIHSDATVKLEPDFQCPLEQDAIHLFHIDTQRVGVLCRHRHESSQGNRKYSNCIIVFTFDMLEEHFTRSPVIHLTGSNGDKHNTMCVSPSDRILCLAVREKNKVVLYSRTGRYLYDYFLGNRWYPRAVSCTENDKIVVVGYHKLSRYILPNWGDIRQKKGTVFDDNEVEDNLYESDDEHENSEDVESGEFATDFFTNFQPFRYRESLLYGHIDRAEDQAEEQGQICRYVEPNTASSQIAVYMTPNDMPSCMNSCIMSESYLWCNEVVNQGGTHNKTLRVYLIDTTSDDLA